MTIGPPLRRALLTAHVVASVGWLGAIAASLVLAIGGATGDGDAAYPALELVGRYALVPLGGASLLTGLLQGLTSKWGVLQHYWVVTKLLINVVAVVVLLMYLQTLESLAATPDVRSASPVVHAVGALVLLLAAVVLSIFKPSGRTRHGWRRQERLRARRGEFGVE